MKVVAILGGLGSQMFKYAFFLNIREKSKEECWIDTTSYYLNKVWNGYELERIFGIREKDMVSLYPENYLEDARNIESWKYAVLQLIETYKCPVTRFFKGKEKSYRTADELQKTQSEFLRKIHWYITYLPQIWFHKKDKYRERYWESNEIQYFDEFNHLSDKYILKDKAQLKKIFQFPEFEEKENVDIAERIKQTESIAIHVRRSDHMYDNGRLYDSGYIKEAVSYMRAHVKEPVFFVFSEEAEWCKKNLDILGLSTQDNVHFIDWNTGEKSFRDMQLMTYCKHNILINSSFSWWGYYLSSQEKKIVIAPKNTWDEVEIHI